MFHSMHLNFFLMSAYMMVKLKVNSHDLFMFTEHLKNTKVIQVAKLGS